VEPGNVGEIKKAILQMKDSRDMRIQLGKANRQKMVEECSWQKVANQYLEA